PGLVAEEVAVERDGDARLRVGRDDVDRLAERDLRALALVRLVDGRPDMHLRLRELRGEGVAEADERGRARGADEQAQARAAVGGVRADDVVQRAVDLLPRRGEPLR